MSAIQITLDVVLCGDPTAQSLLALMKQVERQVNTSDVAHVRTARIAVSDAQALAPMDEKADPVVGKYVNWFQLMGCPAEEVGRMSTSHWRRLAQSMDEAVPSSEARNAIVGRLRSETLVTA